MRNLWLTFLAFCGVKTQKQAGKRFVIKVAVVVLLISLTIRLYVSLVSFYLSYNYLFPYFSASTYKLILVGGLALILSLFNFLQFTPKFRRKINTHEFHTLVRSFYLLFLVASVGNIWFAHDYSISASIEKTIGACITFGFCVFIEPGICKILYKLFEEGDDTKHNVGKSHDEPGGMVVQLYSGNPKSPRKAKEQDLDTPDTE
jgi:hypothetical protein